KLPAEAAALCLMAGLAWFVFHQTPELQRAARPPEAARPTAEADRLTRQYELASRDSDPRARAALRGNVARQEPAPPLAAPPPTTPPGPREMDNSAALAPSPPVAPPAPVAPATPQLEAKSPRESGKETREEATSAPAAAPPAPARAPLSAIERPDSARQK